LFYPFIFSACSETVKPEAANEIEVRPRSFSSRNLDITDIDTETNPQLVASYVKDIFKYLNELEVLNLHSLLGSLSLINFVLRLKL
jgi:hypothetical protein